MRGRRSVGVALWAAAVVLMLAAAVYQRRTGPTRPLRGSFEIAGSTHRYRLPRSQETTSGAIVSLPDPGPAVTGTLRWRRYPLDEPYHELPLTRDPRPFIAQTPPGKHAKLSRRLESTLLAMLPVQPAAGKLEYYLQLQAPGERVRIPDLAAGTVVLRFKDPVPLASLLPHILFMFLSVLIGMRAGLSALFQPATMRRYALLALAGMSVGGMFLGPVAQKHAFGEYWTGFPKGYDLTDNKTLIMWLVWVIACGVLALGRRRRWLGTRVAVVLAALVMTVVYLIPHSLRGSQLDYARLEAGAAPQEAIRTGGE